ncbi:MAG: hypothetical protein JWM65_606 [Sphingomonas bacterium]|nr:hypothetical protein [Sphingomonas bacterium]
MRSVPSRWFPNWPPASAGELLLKPTISLVALLFGCPATAAAHQAPLRSCTYEFRNDVRSFARCAWVDATGGPHVISRHLRRLTYDRHGLAEIFVDRWYLVRRDGRSAPVMLFDNWAEGFADGRVRSEHGDKIGYIDRRLHLAIPRRYDGAYPFAHGFAAVCTGCRVALTGEHSSYVGGLWGCIDIHGVLSGPMHRQDQHRDCGSTR